MRGADVFEERVLLDKGVKPSILHWHARLQGMTPRPHLLGSEIFGLPVGLISIAK